MLEKGDSVGDYKLVKFLGRGQFGEVWLAEKKLQFSTRSVRHALKFLPSPEDDASLKNIEAEVDTWIEAGSHPNVMSVIDMFVAKDKIVIISDFAEGGSLGDWLKSNGGKAPTEESALEMMSGILRGIEHLHERKIVHRDLKPDNILLQGNFPRIADFGISRIVSGATLKTKAIGSPAYMSPEAFNGSKSPQTDVWSAGVIFYELLTGAQPFEDDALWLLMKKIQDEEAAALPEFIKPEIRAIVETALEKNPQKRFQTATEMRRAAERALHNVKSGEYNFGSGEIPQKNISTEIIEIPNSEIPNSNDEKTIADVDVSSGESQETLLNVSDRDLKKITADETVKLDYPIDDNKTFFKPGENKNANETRKSPIDQTGDNQPEKTVDFQESEKLNGERRQEEILKLGDDLKRNRTGGSLENKKGAKFYLGIGGGIVGLFLIAFVVWQFAGEKPAAISNSNSSAANNSNRAKPAAPNAPGGMALVSGGEFMMGRDRGESLAEEPAHKVSVKSFFMDVYETSNGQFIDYLLRNPNAKLPKDWQRVGGDQIDYPQRKSLKVLDTYPVVDVDWNQASDFCREAGKRLPTEEEWEFAARGSSNFIYPWGDEWKDGLANVYSQSVQAIGTKEGASPFGIYDMSGNVWEWTASDFKAYPNGKLPDTFAGKKNLKTIRGGSFEATRNFATTTYRIGWAATGAENYSRTGFRCVKDISE